MKITQLSIDTLERARERFLDTLDQVTVEEANTMPEPFIKSVTWLIWHTSRMLDYQISHLDNTEPLWLTAGYKEQFNLDLPDDTQDWIHTPEEASKVIVSDKSILIDYLNASMQLATNYLEHLDEVSLDDIIDTSYTPAVTRSVRLVSTIDDVVMHSGQAIYAKRLVIGK